MSNPDHKWTFTIAKHRSWSPVSINLLDVVKALPGGELLDIRLQDDGYERYLLSNGYRAGSTPYRFKAVMNRVSYGVPRALGLDRSALKRLLVHPTDQTTFPDVLAQIQCIVRKAT